MILSNSDEYNSDKRFRNELGVYKRRLLITGSRESTPDMRKFARDAVARALELDWTIIVGDAPGIDKTVIMECDKIGCPVAVVGAYNRLRNKSKTGFNISISRGYLERDREMVREADRVLAIWNGKSKGTKYTHDYGLELGKKVHMKNFSK